MYNANNIIEETQNMEMVDSVIAKGEKQVKSNWDK